jgi:pimeloyl-ACP methyl ester carboxylesterase
MNAPSCTRSGDRKGSSCSVCSDPFGNTCNAERGIRFCPAVDLSQRPTSFDGAPIDADVTIPETGNGPWPTIVLLHGYGGSKTSYETSGTGSTNALDNVSYAKRGYAVVTVSNRGFGRSCGHDPATRTTGCDHGYVHLDDTRYEARDVQTLLGQLVDQGIANPAALGAAGGSYGGGLSLELAFLKNRIRLADGTYAAWKSPNGTPLSLKAAWPQIPWSDLASALTPNGRYLDFDSHTAGLATSPIGVGISSYISGLYSAGEGAGWYVPKGGDPAADLTSWRDIVFAGEPFGTDAAASVAQLHDYHSAYTVNGGTPASLLIENGWTDDLFPPAEALRIYESQKAAGNNDVRLLFDDIGHNRAQNKDDAVANSRAMGAAFFDNKLKGIAGGPAAGSATAMTMTCDPAGGDSRTYPSGGPFTATSWENLHPGAVRLTNNALQVVNSGGGDKDTGLALDPLIGSAQSCGLLNDITESGVATYSFLSQGFTMLGLPTIKAKVGVTSKYGQLIGRLWDVSAGKRRLITRGVYRLLDNQSGYITFQLHGNAYVFPAGHTVKLELLAIDSSYYTKSKGVFKVNVRNMTLELPTLQAKNAVPGIVTPTLGKFKR